MPAGAVTKVILYTAGCHKINGLVVCVCVGMWGGYGGEGAPNTPNTIDCIKHYYHVTATNNAPWVGQVDNITALRRCHVYIIDGWPLGLVIA